MSTSFIPRRVVLLLDLVQVYSEVISELQYFVVEAASHSAQEESSLVYRVVDGGEVVENEKLFDVGHKL